MTTKLSNSSHLKRGVLGSATMAVLAGLLALWCNRRAGAQPAAPPDTDSLPVAGVATVIRADLSQEVTLAAEFRPYVEAALNAKVTGYVSQMNVDFGDTVKAGQVLATIEVPELQSDLDRAQAAAQKAEADHVNAHLIYTRLVAVNREHPNLVAQQDLDTAAANDQATDAAIAAAKAEAEKYQTLVGYTKITAPFDGIVTRRYADPGTLIQAGTSSGGQPLMRLSDNYRLRLDFPVTVDYVQDIQVGAPVTVRVESLHGKTFTGKISRFSQDVDDNTRTMTTEIEVPNTDLTLKPGMYATVILQVEKHPHVLVIPAEAVSSGKVPEVYVVNHDHEIEERAVTLGMETPDQYEVLSGLAEGDLVVIGNRTAFQTGEKVAPKLIQLTMRNEQ